MTPTTPQSGTGPESEPGPGPAVPEHVAIIMDGNGRWAASRGMPRLAGHRAGTDNVRGVLKALGRAGVRYVTLFAFSTENWGRPDDEVSGLLEILGSIIEDQVRDLHASNIRILHLGNQDHLPDGLAKAVREGVERTRNNTGLTLCVAFDYGGRREVVDAVRRVVEAGLSAEDIDEESLRSFFYLPEVPDPDLVIRTGGEQRLSNFLIWQAAYSEYYQTPTFWPDFDEAEVERALEEYQRRQRRFGVLPGSPGVLPGEPPESEPSATV